MNDGNGVDNELMDEPNEAAAENGNVENVTGDDGEGEGWVIIENKTSQRILLEGEGQSHVIPAYGKKEVPGEFVKDIEHLEQWEAWNLIEMGRKGNETISFRGTYALGCFVWVAVLAGVVGLIGWLTPSLETNASFWKTLGGSVLVVAIILFVWWLSGKSEEWTKFVDTISPYLSVLLFLVIGLGLPAYIIYQFSEAYQLIRAGSLNVVLLGRMLQFGFIAIAATVPALLYFLFDRQRLEKVRRNFYREVMRLDPDIRTLAEAETKYSELVAEIYGTSQATGFLLGAGSPILISTLLIILGWTWTLLPIGETTQIASELALDALFSPVPNALAFGFLGAYFFALNMVFRGYIRADLTPKTYAHITLRLLTTVVIVWVLSLIPAFSGAQSGVVGGGADWRLLTFAFFVGIVPETGLALLQDSLRRSWLSKVFLQRIIPSLEEDHPLTKLEGINLYDRARLLEEGIENVENLAHSPLIELMLRTRIPTPRLVDMFDQAILYLHIHEIDGGWTTLRKLGIRTATDLERVYGRLEGDADKARHFLSALGEPADEEGVSPLETVLAALEDDDWMAYLRNWRRCSQVKDRTFTLHDFASDLPRVARVEGAAVAVVAD